MFVKKFFNLFFKDVIPEGISAPPMRGDTARFKYPNVPCGPSDNLSVNSGLPSIICSLVSKKANGKPSGLALENKARAKTS